MTKVLAAAIRILSLTVVAVWGLFLITAFASADSLPAPTGKVLLTISGNIQQTNGDGVARFDRDMLMALESRSLKVETPWTEGTNIFKGPLIREVMKKVGATGSTLMATAINDYQTEIPLQDTMDYDFIFAMQLNGKTLTVRERGPLWVILPWSDHTELQTEVYYSRSIWQLSSISVND